MAFKGISVVKVDYAHVSEVGSGDEVTVPYILSDTPPAEWKQYFESHAPANATIVGNTVRYPCPNDTAALQKYGACWHTVAELVDDANRYYLGLELRRWQERCRQAGREVHEDERSEFEGEWGRYMGRD